MIAIALLLGVAASAASGPSAAVVPVAASNGVQAGERAGWTALQVPGVCVETPPAPYLARLVRGHHLLLPGDALERESPSPRPTVPLRSVIDWLQEESRRTQSDLRVLSGGPPLLVRGSPVALSEAGARLADLERAAQAFQVELRVWLTPSLATSTHPARPEFETATRANAPWGERRVVSGEVAVFGSRESAGFLGAWAGEVASSSGVAEPKLVRALSGRTLHLYAARADGGTRVRLNGWLDLAEPGATTVFDAGTPDLGVIQQPSVHAVQVAFGGSVESGGVLAVALDGAPFAQAQCTLWIEARTTVDPTEGPWRAFDTAWLEAPDFALPPVLPGAGLDEVGADEATSAGVLEPLTASTLAQVFEEARARGAARSVASVLWAPGFLCVPRSEAQATAELELLIQAASKDRSREAELVMKHGKLRALVPAVSGATVRLLVSTERTVMNGYSIQIATETWMPTPTVERVIDGGWVQGRWTGERLELAGWSASSQITAQLSREEARLGRMQLVTRGFRAERGSLDRAHPRVELFPSAGALQGLTIELVQR
ncbi:MAG: hypothetical protein IT453_22040 [Planctomycetes bacterium]|nr:hypothetical protein [Planctomycetota bacterium]